MKVALADKPAVPFRVPPGIKLIRVDRKTGMRAGGDGAGTILEAFKPGTGAARQLLGHRCAPAAARSACRRRPTGPWRRARAGCTETNERDREACRS